MTIKRLGAVALVAALVLTLTLFAAGPASAQTVDQPVVYAVLFYSPECPHCEAFLMNDWPVMHEEFGDQLVVLFVNVLTPGGQQLARAAYQTYNVPAEQAGVPMMIIGQKVLIGGIDIPQQGPPIIRDGLANGGIDLPPIPGMKEAFDAAVAQAQTAAAATAQAQGTQSPAPTEVAQAAPSGTGIDTAGETGHAAGWLAADPVAGVLGMVVLLGLAASLVAVLWAGARVDATWLAGVPGRSATLLVGLFGLGLSTTLVVRAGGDTLALVLSALAAAALAAASAVMLLAVVEKRRADLPGWLVLLVVLGGLAAAVYLTVVETGQQQAACGVVGDCNAVQQSPYASLFGVLPIGVLGVTGYVAMALAWLVAGLSNGRLADLARAALFGMTVFGVAFSIYLTCLELFVIGAVCVWCLTSALTMALLLWLTAAPGWQALRAMRGGV